LTDCLSRAPDRYATRVRGPMRGHVPRLFCTPLHNRVTSPTASPPPRGNAAASAAHACRPHSALILRLYDCLIDALHGRFIAQPKSAQVDLVAAASIAMHRALSRVIWRTS
jgi:hypothetical protein